MLTEGWFNQMVESMLTRMGVNLAQDGHLAVVAMGVTGNGGVVSVVAGPEGTETSSMPGPDGIPVYVIPGAFAENTEELERIFARHGVVAVLSMGEMWGLSGEDAVQARESGTPASAHPKRTELAVLMAYAPSLNYFRTVAVPMVRASAAEGSAFMKTSPTFIGTAKNFEGGPDHTGSVTLNWSAVKDTRTDLTDPDSMRMDSWLFHVLPLTPPA